MSAACGRLSWLRTTSKLVIGGMVWAGPNRVVVSTIERIRANAYNSNLWEVRLNARRELDTRGLRKLTAWTDFPIQPGSLTTDGKRLVFVRSFAQRDVYVAGIDGARSRLEAPRRLTLDLGDDYPTAWTRDSKSVILTSDRAGAAKIFRQGVDQQEAEPHRGLAGDADSSPDGAGWQVRAVLQHRAETTRLPFDACALDRGNAGAGRHNSGDRGLSLFPRWSLLRRRIAWAERRLHRL